MEEEDGLNETIKDYDKIEQIENDNDNMNNLIEENKDDINEFVSGARTELSNCWNLFIHDIFFLIQKEKSWK